MAGAIFLVELISVFFQPILDNRFSGGHVRGRDSKSFLNRRIRRLLLNRFEGVEEALPSMRYEWDDGLAMQIMVAEEGENRRRNGSPPVRVSQENNLIGVVAVGAVID